MHFLLLLSCWDLKNSSYELLLKARRVAEPVWKEELLVGLQVVEVLKTDKESVELSLFHMRRKLVVDQQVLSLLLSFMILSTGSSQTLSRGQEFSANHSSRGCRPYDLNNVRFPDI
ncbi:hypothetical protein YC2023_001347 [Brassica napus]